MALRILGIDPGFRSLGWAVIECDGSSTVCLEAGVIRTAKSKHKIPVWQDNQDRCEVLAQQLLFKAKAYAINLIAVEGESWTRTSSDRVIGMSRGIIYGLACAYNYPVIQWHPKDVKKELTGRKSASKTEIQDWLCENVDGVRKHLDLIPKTQKEHAADAAAIAVTELRRGNLAKIFMAAEAGRV